MARETSRSDIEVGDMGIYSPEVWEHCEVTQQREGGIDTQQHINQFTSEKQQPYLHLECGLAEQLLHLLGTALFCITLL